MQNDDLWHQFDTSLHQRAHNFEQKLVEAKSEILSKHSAAGRLRSGSTLMALAAAFERLLREFCRDEFAHARSWLSVEGVDDSLLRSRASEHLLEIVARLPEGNYVSYGEELRGSAAQAVAGMIADTKAKATVEIRNFEIGVGKPTAAGSPTYVINAHTIVGGVQQGTVGSTQSNVSEISVGDVTQALERLSIILGHIRMS